MDGDWVTDWLFQRLSTGVTQTQWMPLDQPWRPSTQFPYRPTMSWHCDPRKRSASTVALFLSISLVKTLIEVTPETTCLIGSDIENYNICYVVLKLPMLLVCYSLAAVMLIFLYVSFYDEKCCCFMLGKCRMPQATPETSCLVGSDMLSIIKFKYLCYVVSKLPMLLVIVKEKNVWLR